MRKRVVALAVLALGTLAALGVFFFGVVRDISSPPRRVPAAEVAREAPKPIVRIGVISRFEPTVIYQGYQPIMDYLSSAGPYTFELKLGSSYRQTVEDLVNGRVAAAFLGTFIYTEAHEKFGVVPILKPLNERYEPTFHVVVIARADSPIASIADLRGKTLALPSPESFSGNWMTEVAFARYGLSRGELRAIQYFEHHHTVVFQVLRGSFDAGVVKDRVAAEYQGRGIKAIASSEPIPGSPVVVAGRADPQVTAFLIRALLAVDPRRAEYADTVRNWDQEFTHGFAVARDQDYNEVRKLMATGGTR